MIWSFSLPVTWLSLPAGVPGTIRYTLDGSVPTESSQRYVAAIALRANTTVTAKAFGAAAGVATPPSVFVYFTDATQRLLV